MKYPLQKELEKDLLESTEVLAVAYTNKENPTLEQFQQLASKYHNAIKRINDICVNRKRF